MGNSLYSGYSYDSTSYDEFFSALEGMPTGVYVWIAIASILAIVGGIVLYCCFTNKKGEPKGKFAKWLKDFLNFKVMWIEIILKILYYVATIFVMLFSFTFLAAGGVGVVSWLMCLVLGPILVRLCYEATMMFIMIWRNTKDIADNTKKK